MENYEKKYKEALERAKVVNPGTKDYNIVTAIFPELKKTKDELIKEELIHFLEICQDTRLVGNRKQDEWISWLEKQGKQKPTNKEPKFKVGDWVVRNYLNNTRDIDKVINVKQLDDETYGYYLEDNVYFSGCYEDEYHLWTIQDAKEGDILQANKCTLIFDSLAKDINDNTVISSWYYCDTKTFYGMGTCKPDLWVIDGVVPATKEQCDILFQKVEKAGYKWDTEKKELTKL